MLSSLLDSLFDVGMSGLNLFAVRYALRPADEEHRFGHNSIEDIVGLAQFTFMLGMMLLVIVESARELYSGAEITRPAHGIGVMVLSMVLTTALVLYQRRVYRQTGSLIVQADALHYLGDVLINAGIIVSMLVSLFAGIDWFDPLLAIVIALYVIHEAWAIGRRALNNLMDREMPDACRAQIEAIVARHKAVHAVRRLRTRQSGVKPFIEMDIWLNGQLTLAEAHALTDALEADLRAAFPRADIMIHQEPAS